MKMTTSVDIDAPPEKVWEVMSDVERWHEWTKSISRIQILGGGPLRAGSRVRIRQPKLPSAVWNVTALEPGRYFEWQNQSPGITSVATHAIEAKPDGTSRVTLSIDQSGVFGSLIARMFENRISRPYMEMEAQGLKRRSEE
jgi:uncharacterized membrane protein